MRVKSLFLFVLFITLGLFSFAQKINVRIFADKTIKEINIIPSFGRYSLRLNNQEVIKLTKISKLNIKAEGERIKIALNDSLLGSFKNVGLQSEGLKCFFQIEPNGLDKRRYDDNLIITSSNGLLRLINNIETESYIAGVVQAETWGATKNVDFFKVQAVCVRNYLMMNLGKHKKDGFHVCDVVHCQAYKGRANQVEVIEGAYNSKGEIIVDSLGNMVETLFHSNSGGQTVNASDVWGRHFPHLISKIDSFSIGQTRGYAWEKFIPLKDWKKYFRDKGVDVKNDSIANELLTFNQQQGRKKDILGVPLVQVRKDFNLRSTFFDVNQWGSEIKLTGRGYGHGVGMSQEGAIKMCDEGYEYWRVIEHYYTGTRIKRIDEDSILNRN